MAFRALSIDLDDTVWPCAPVIQAAELAVFSWLGERAPALVAAHDMAALREQRLQLMRDCPQQAHDLSWARRESLARSLRALGLDESIADEATRVFRRARNRVTPYADVPSALARLAGEYTLVSLTNGNAQLQHTPLAGCFHFELDAVLAGAAKPHPAMFELALRHAGVNAAEMLHVGDDPLRDVQAARDFGIPAVWMDREGRDWPDDLPPPRWRVKDFDGLIRLLESL